MSSTATWWPNRLVSPGSDRRRGSRHAAASGLRTRRGCGADGTGSDPAVVGQQRREQRALEQVTASPSRRSTFGRERDELVEPRACRSAEPAVPRHLAALTTTARPAAADDLLGLRRPGLRRRRLCPTPGVTRRPVGRSVTVAPGGGVKSKTEDGRRRRVERGEAHLERRLWPAARRRPAPGSGRGSRRRSRSAPSRSESRGSRGCEHQLVGRPARHHRGAVGADLGRGVDRLQGTLLPPAAGSAPVGPSAASGRRQLAGVWAGRYVGGRRPSCWTRSRGRCRCGPGRTRPATRAARGARCCGPAYQTRSVWVPDTSERRLRAARRRRPGRPGRPRSRSRSTVPERPESWACCTSTSSCAAVRSGRSPCAVAVTRPAAEPPATSSSAATAGTSQRRRARRESGDMTAGSLANL